MQLLTPLTSPKEIKQACATMLSTLKRDCTTHRRWLGWQGGKGEYDLNWNAREGFWICADAFPDKDRWIFLFGIDDPGGDEFTRLVCEINPPKAGINRRCAGLFARDADGAVWLTHSGKIGGGRKGIGKSAFLPTYRGARALVAWEDKPESEVIVIGRVDSEKFARHIANFVREVERFKTRAVSGDEPETTSEASSAFGEEQFNPEFFGKRLAYQASAEIEAHCDHGIIINVLAEIMKEKGFNVANDRNRDLYAYTLANQMQILFEAKTDLTTSSIYQAVGQLLFHSVSQSPLPVCVLVVPALPSAEVRKILNKLQIRTLVFDWANQKPTFRDLAEVIA